VKNQGRLVGRSDCVKPTPKRWFCAGGPGTLREVSETTGQAQQVVTETGFTGPVFVIGLPRSGTKLLRDLLRGHSRIRIPDVETNLLPRWVANWERFGDLSQRRRFSRFYRWNGRSPYFLYLERHPGGPITEEAWFDAVEAFTPAGVFEALIRHDVGAPASSGLIWGDKSPDYVFHVPLLARLFEDARIIHIVRDVRDCCLSLHSRGGANMARAAQLWVDGVTKARRDGVALDGRYLELRYEDLLRVPEDAIGRACELLGVELEPGMLRLRYSTEHTGDAQGAHEIVAGNAEKYRGRMDERTLRRVEEIAGEALSAFGYELAYTGPARRVSGARMQLYRMLDALQYARQEGRRIGYVRHAQLQLGRLTRN
jgi:hypothetical protein